MGPTVRKKSSNYDPVRAACIHALSLVFDKGWKSDDAIKQVTASNQFNDLDRRFLMQLCHGVIKMRRRLDFTYSFYLNKPNAKIDRITRNILRLGLYQLQFTDRIPHGAAVSESVNLARGMVHESRGSFVNAILRNYLRTPEKVIFPDRSGSPVEYLGSFFSYPDWFVEYCINEFGIDKTEILLAKGNESPHLTYRVNHLKYSDDQLMALLKEHYIEYSQGKFLSEFYHIHRQGIPLEQELVEGGRVYIQDEAAGLAVRLLAPKPKDSILDLCAAPGGKSTYAASLMHNHGRITAVDVSHDRLQTVVDNARRLGITCIAPVVCDALDFKGPASNRILLDVPCSGWGVVGKHSDLRWMKDRSDSIKLAEIQARLIRHAADLVTPGGILVYSTCTIIRDENDSIVEEFLLERRDFSVETPGKTLGEGIVNERGFVKTYPNIDYLDGAFCVRLKKKLGAKSKKP